MKMNPRRLAPFALVLAFAGCSDDPSTEPTGTTAPDPEEWTTLVRGTLFTDDMTEAQTFHDNLAAGGEPDAKAAGDFGHDAMLGTTLLGTSENGFLGLDRWRDSEAMSGFYASPAFADAFGMLFSGPPNVEMFEHRPGWHQWGDLTAGDAASEHYFVVVRGTLAEADPAAAQAQHDEVAGGGEETVRAAGDVAHVAYVGLEDERELLAIDVWTSRDAIEAVYSDPDFVAAFGSLFAAPPTVGVYASTEWHQW